jgi:hypothetical protein
MQLCFLYVPRRLAVSEWCGFLRKPLRQTKPTAATLVLAELGPTRQIVPDTGEAACYLDLYRDVADAAKAVVVRAAVGVSALDAHGTAPFSLANG